ncbi:neutral/alkaline non-lysosomal ceramidase N-terminal domain-containing protein [Candidatus Harpocratesius sp.]
MNIAFGKIIITPKNDGVNVSMAGYTRSFPAQGKLDDIYARGMLIEEEPRFEISNSSKSFESLESPKRFLILSLDFLKVPLSISQYIKQKLTKVPEFKLKPENIMIHAIHTHSAPDLTGEFYWPGSFLNVFRGIMFGVNRNDRYIVYFTDRIIKMVRKMVLHLEPSQIAIAHQKITEDILINRRNPIRKSKKDLWVLVCRSQQNGHITGILGHFPMHPTTLSFQNNKLSADYPGRFCAKIENTFDQKTHAIFITGAAGDLNPITTCGTDFDVLENDPKARLSVYEQLGTYEHTQKIGFLLAKKAINLANSIPKDQYYDSFTFQSHENKFPIYIQDKQPFIYNWGRWLQNKLFFYLKRAFLFPIATLHSKGRSPNFPGMMLERASLSIDFQHRLKVWTIIQFVKCQFFQKSNQSQREPLYILGIPGEVFEDLGKKLKQAVPQNTFRSKNILLFQNTNDWVAYLFELKDYLIQGGYESIVSASPTCGTEILKSFKKVFSATENAT